MPDTSDKDTPLTYARAGVDIVAGARLVDRIRPAAARTHRPELLAGAGGFAALATLPGRYTEPVIVTGTDGVGTKLMLAIEAGFCETIGQDLVAMCVNDVITTGAEPLLFLDYFATSRLDVDQAATVIEGIARACELAGCALAGGETAEMPGLYPDRHFDLAGFCIGVVERERIVDGRHLRDGDVLIALASDGAHSNGYSLVRRLLERDADPVQLAALARPTRLYPQAVAAACALDGVHGMAHVTGGGLIENLPRMLPGDSALVLEIELTRTPEQPVFAWLQRTAAIDQREMLATFNCGIGFVLAVAADTVDATLAALAGVGETAWVAGAVRTGPLDQALDRAEPSAGTLRLDAHGGFTLS